MRNRPRALPGGAHPGGAHAGGAHRPTEPPGERVGAVLERPGVGRQPRQAPRVARNHLRAGRARTSGDGLRRRRVAPPRASRGRRGCRPPGEQLGPIGDVRRSGARAADEHGARGTAADRRAGALRTDEARPAAGRRLRRWRRDRARLCPRDEHVCSRVHARRGHVRPGTQGRRPADSPPPGGTPRAPGGTPRRPERRHDHQRAADHRQRQRTQQHSPSEHRGEVSSGAGRNATALGSAPQDVCLNEPRCPPETR